MKKGIKISVLLGLILIGGTALLGQNEFKKEYDKNFKVNESSTVRLVNKYGKMHIENWDQNTVSVKVVVIVKTSSKSKAEKAFERIDISFSEEGKVVSAVTDITKGINNTNFSINYEVKMPKNINVDLSNKYGNLFLDQVNGHANIAVKYGNFTINKLGRGKEKPANHISVGYSNGYCNITECGWLKLEAAYSKVGIGTATALIIGSKYSSLKIQKCKSIVTESKYDHPFKVGVVKNFVCTGAYSNFEISKLYSMLELDVKYSDFEVNNVDKGFELVKVKMRYGKVTLEIPDGVSYELKAESAYGSVNYPHSKNINRVIEQSESKIWGIVGNNSNPKAKVIIDSRYGSVDLD